MQGIQAHKAALTVMTAPGEERTNSFGKLGVCIGVSFIIAPIIDGFVTAYSKSGYIYVGIILPIIALWITHIFIPEHKIDEKDSEISWKSVIQLIKKEKVSNLLLQKNLSVLFQSSAFIVLQLFLIDKFALTPKQNSFIQMFTGISMMVVGGVLLPILRKKLLEAQLITLGIFNIVRIL